MATSSNVCAPLKSFIAELWIKHALHLWLMTRHRCVWILANFFRNQNFYAFFLTPQIIIDFSLLRLNYSCKFFFLLSVDNLFCKYNWESFQRPWYVKPDVFNGNYITTTISLSKQKSSVTSLSDQDITSPHNFNTA